MKIHQLLRDFVSPDPLTRLHPWTTLGFRPQTRWFCLPHLKPSPPPMVIPYSMHPLWTLNQCLSGSYFSDQWSWYSSWNRLPSFELDISKGPRVKCGLRTGRTCGPAI